MTHQLKSLADGKIVVALEVSLYIIVCYLFLVGWV